ncbi:MAG: polyprenyl synthetase family protein [[Clostridium] leptum]
MAFQIRDDILDVISDPETLGKPVGSDDKNEKSTYVSLLGTGGKRQLVNEVDPAKRKAPCPPFLKTLHF